MTLAWDRAARSRAPWTREETEADRIRAEVALLETVLANEDNRWAQPAPRQRPHHSPIQLMRTLELRAARDWAVTPSGACTRSNDRSSGSGAGQKSSSSSLVFLSQRIVRTNMR